MAPRLPKPGQSLADLFPEIAAQADRWDPTMVTYGSKRKLQWQCEKGHKYIADPISRTTQNHGCPYCSGRRVLEGFNDLATTHPQFAIEADGWNPNTVSAGSHIVQNWKCNLGHLFRVSPNQRTSRTSNCPTCANVTIETGFNDLETMHPEIAAEAFGWDPTIIGAGSSKRLPWRCLKQQHIWESTIINRTWNGSNCPVCVGQLVIIGINDLVTTDPDIAFQAYEWDPTTLTSGSKKKRQWKCELGHIFTQAVVNRTTSQRQGCPYCSSTLVLAGFNDLATKFPEIAADADGWEPSTIIAGSNKKLKWKCKLGHSYFQAVGNRSGAQKQGCPVCANLQLLVGFNDLATTHPKLATEAFGWDATTVVFGSGVKREWKCPLGHNYMSSVRARSSPRTKNGCPVCNGKVVLPGFNDMATTHPSLAAEAFGWDPSAVSAGSSRRKVKWQCSDGHVWETHPNARLGGHGCPTCARTGFDPNKDGWLYFLENDNLEMFQVGISNVLVNRLKRHSKGGWEVIEIRGPMEGHLTQQLETAILYAIEKRGAVLGHKASIEKFDGYSEAWTKASLLVSSFKELLDFVYEDDELHK